MRATQRDASSAAPAASASVAATAGTTSTGDALRRSYAAIRASMPAVAHAQRDPGGFAAVRGEAVLGADRVEQRRAQLVVAGQRDSGADEVGELLRMPEEEVGEAGRRAQERPQRAPALRIGLQSRGRRPASRRAIRASAASASSGSAAGHSGSQQLVAGEPRSELELAEEGLGLGEPGEPEPRELGESAGSFARGHASGAQSISRLLFSSKGVTCERYSCHSLRLLSST